MDCRNFVNEKCICEQGKELEKMFELQSSLLKEYLPIEGLPEWPLNVNTRKAQAILKDMSARVIEELGEGYESTTLVLQMMDSLGYNFNSPKWTKENYQQLLNHLQNSNEEQADAIAFFINLLLYSNIGVDDIKSYILSKRLHVLVDPNTDEDGISTQFIMKVGFGILQSRFDINLIHVCAWAWDIFNPTLFDNFNIKDYDKVASYIPAFRRISWSTHDGEAKMCWELTYHLSVARNFLKNKPWKQTGEITDEQRFQEEVVIAFLELMGYFHFIGFNPNSLLQLRYKKHLVNQFRIKSNY